MNPETTPERLEQFLSLVLNQKVRIRQILTTDNSRIADESSLLVMDILIELEDGSLANVEVQKVGYKFPGQRCACYSADLLLRQYKRVKGEKGKSFSYQNIKSVYTFVLFEKSSYYLAVSGDKENRISHYIQTVPSKEYYGKIYDSTKMYAMFYVHPTTWTGIYRREFLEKYHIRHNESPGAAFQDNGFWFQVFSYAKRVYLIPDGFYCYRVDNEASSINSGTGAFRIFEEYAFIHQFLEQNPELKERLIYTYSFFRFDNYLARYYQTAPAYQEEFAVRVAEEYKKAEAAGEIDRALFTPQFRSFLDPMVEERSSWIFLPLFESGLLAWMPDQMYLKWEYHFIRSWRINMRSALL